jgi:hypothetical protein
MIPMALSAFTDPAAPPTPETLESMLGPAAPLWSDLCAILRGLVGDVVEAWNHGGAKVGWSMRLVHDGRILAYLTPQAGHALVGVVLGEKAIARAEASAGLSTPTREAIAAAPRYAEGRGVRIVMATADDLSVALELARIKVGSASR